MEGNRLEIRMNLLQERVKKLGNKLYSELTEPKPYGQVKLSSDEQLDKYLELEAQGRIGELRRSNGGPFPDEEVDKYSISMENLKAKRLAGHTLSAMEGPQEYYEEEDDDF